MLNTGKLCLIGALLAACCEAGQVNAQHADQFDLTNGLHVILKPLASAKTTALVVLYAVGNRHDPPGRSGMAHLAEHLYVTCATATKPARTVQEYVKEYPDGWNAQTGDTYTVIASVFKPERLDAELTDAADRIRSLKVTRADLDRELPRIDEELTNMYQGIVRLAAQNWGRHYVQPLAHGGRRGGIIAQLETLRVQEIQTWLDRFYKPVNAVLVAAGPFDPVVAKQLITSNLGTIERGERPELNARPQPDEQAVRQVAVTPRVPGRSSRVLLAYRAPQPNNALYPAFLIQAARLQTNANTLSKDFRDFPVSYMPVDLPETLFVTLGVGDRSPEDVIRSVNAFVAKQTAERLTPADAVRTQNTFGFLLGLSPLPDRMLANNPYGVAFSLGRRHQMGIVGSDLTTALDRVDAAQLRRVAATVFSAERGTAIITHVEQ